MEVNKIKQMIEGWSNVIAPREELKELIEEVYKERLSICDICDYDSENKKKTGWSTIRIDRHCTNCGCTTEPKLKCLSCECPLAKWKSITTSEKEYALKNNSK